MKLAGGFGWLGFGLRYRLGLLLRISLPPPPTIGAALTGLATEDCNRAAVFCLS